MAVVFALRGGGPPSSARDADEQGGTVPGESIRELAVAHLQRDGPDLRKSMFALAAGKLTRHLGRRSPWLS